MTDRDVPGRVLAFDAAVRLAIGVEDDGRGWGYRPELETSEIVAEADGDVSNRTALRAAKDAAALGWLEDKRQGWDAGPRADEFDPSVELPGEPVE